MNRRLLFAITLVLLFAVGVIIWFFVFATPKTAPTFNETQNPLSLSDAFKKGFQFIYTNEDIETSTSTTEITLPQPEVLTEIWNKPATGQTFITKTIVNEIDATTTKGTSTITIKKLVQGTSSILMFVDRITGHVYGYNRGNNKLYQISNTTIPGVYDAYIFNNGRRIVLRYADNDKKSIIGILATIPDGNENDQPKPLENTTYLPSQVTSVAVNKKGTLLSYFVAGDVYGSIYTISQKETSLITNTPFKEWSLSYGGDTLYATTKPSAYVEGQTATPPFFDFVVGGKTGLMTTPGEKNILLNSMWSSQGLKTFLTNNGNQKVLDIRTLSSKCSFGSRDFLLCAVPDILPKGSQGLPDDWFQGRVSFNDSFVFINVTTGETYPFYSFDASKKIVFDITNITISDANEYVAFTRKQSASLWFLDTTRIGGE